MMSNLHAIFGLTLTLLYLWFMVYNLFNQSLKENYLTIFLFNLTLLFLATILYYFNYNILSINLTYFTTLNFFSYALLYRRIKADICLSSYIYYISNMGILLIYIYGCYSLVLFKYQGPLLYEDLPLYSKYRYIFCCIFVIIFIIIYLLNLKNKDFATFLALVKFPYLQEEIRIILKGFFDDFLGSCCILISNTMTKYKSLRYLYFSLHFVFVILIKVITALLFFNFVFFSGDFYIFLYFIPFSFASWILGNLFYYHFWVIEGNKNHIQDCLSIMINGNANIHIEDNYVHALPSAFTFRLTPFGYSEGFCQEHYPILIAKWLDFSSLDLSLTKYKSGIRIISIFIFCIYLICWFYITLNFFFLEQGPI